jgi:porin
MHTHRLVSLCCLAVLSVPVLAQEAAEPAAPTTQPAAPGSWFEQWTQGPKMTGNWGGLRDDLAAKGISFNLDVTQIMQQNAHGGASTNRGLRYSGSADMTLMIDTEKAGLWPGGLILINAEPRWGLGANQKVGSLMPVNLDAFKPTADDDCEMALSEWIYFQRLFNDKLTLIAGKLDGSRAFDRNAFANDERTQFMNGALRNNMIIPSFLPYTNLGVGAVVDPVEWLSVITAVADSEGRATTTGFETTFHGPTHTTVIHEWDFKIKPFGLPGTQRIGFLWSSKEGKHTGAMSPFKETAPLMIKMLGLGMANKVVGMIDPYNTSPDNVGLYYNFDQYVYTEKDDPTQGVGLFGRFGWAREDVNPINYFYSIGVGGKGVIPTRDKDTFGVGYYYLDLSNDLPSVVHKEAGVEMFYNIEITPWLHITPDIQVIADPGGTRALNETAFVYGIRMQMNL